MKFSRSPARSTAAVSLLCCYCSMGTATQTSIPYYEATWASTDEHMAAPEWFRDAKFGVYWHWGVFSTPQHGSEWYGRNMYEPGNEVRAWHTEHYGAPEQWGYQNFILGADDLAGSFVEFRPVLKSAGGAWDPAEWLAVVKASGARFAGPVTEHHDGFSMWDSKVNEWNSVAHGPNIDLVQLWAGLVRDSGMKLLIAMHHAYNTNGFWQYAPPQNDSSLQKLYGQLGKGPSDELWLAKHKEVLDHVQPDMIWNDFSLDSPGYCIAPDSPCSIGEQQRLDFLAYYFNRGVEWDKDVLTTHKVFDAGFHNTSSVVDFERGGPQDIVRPYWLTDDAISASSWSYTVGITYYTSTQMIHSLLDRISKNGNMLLNISPTAGGVIPDEQQQVLLDIGAFLDRHGEAVYDTRAWDIYGEGPTKAGGGSFTAPMNGTSQDIRFTRDKAKTVLYATVLGWPESLVVSIASLGSDAEVDLTQLQCIELLGASAGQYINVTDWDQSSDALHVYLPASAPPAESPAYVLRLTFRDNIPVPQIAGGASAFTADTVTGPGISLPSSSDGGFSSVFFADAGIDSAEIRLLRVDEGAVVTVYTGADFTGGCTNYTAGVHAVPVGSVGSLMVYSNQGTGV